MNSALIPQSIVLMEHFKIMMSYLERDSLLLPPSAFPILYIEQLLIRRASLVAQMVKNLPEIQETEVRSLGQKDPLEKGMATHSSILAQRIPSTEEVGGLQSMGSQRVKHV